MLAHKASEEGIIAVEHLSGKKPSPMEYNNIPGCVYCHPEVASDGLTEKQALLECENINILANTIIALFDFEINQINDYETIN